MTVPPAQPLTPNLTPPPIQLPGAISLQGATPTHRVKSRPVVDAANVRATIAYALLGIFAGTIAMAFVSFATGWAKISDIRDFVTPFITAEVGLLGAVMGFYYATHDHPAPSPSAAPAATPAPVSPPHTHPTGPTGATGTTAAAGPTGV